VPLFPGQLPGGSNIVEDMHSINIARRSLALSIALLILVFSCCYVSFRSTTIESSGLISITVKDYKDAPLKTIAHFQAKKKSAPSSEKLPSHPKLVINKRLLTVSSAIFIRSFLYVLFFKNGDNSLKDNYSEVLCRAHRLPLFCAWRI
jgi:hypothetical protein